MKRKYKKTNNYIHRIIFVIFLIFIAGILLNIYMNVEINNYANAEEGNKTQQNVINKNDEIKIEDTIEQVSKCVVGISKLKNDGITIFLEGGAEALDLGTGLIVSADGYILTNQHISGNKYSKCYITLYDGREFKANVLWADENIDLAILKIPVNDLEYAVLGDSNKIKVGESVYAIGNPVGFEFQRTVTSGIISGNNRTVKIEDEQAFMEGLIQTDCAINVGNSGGPLINKKGEVIGINTIKITSAEGIGFALPINMAKAVVDTVIKEGEFQQATIGIMAYDREVVPYTDTTLKIETGVYVASVNHDGPAYNAGVREKDIITHIDGNEVKKINDLREYIYKKKVGDVVRLEIKRKNKILNIGVTLGKKY